MGWLSITRRGGERIRIGPDIWVELEPDGFNKVRVKILAPAAVRVDREELLPDGEQLAAVERRGRRAQMEATP
jgi:sRNA-binding carbon storage regulator CsrA